MNCKKCGDEINKDQGIWVKFGSDRAPKIYLCKNCAGYEYLSKTFQGNILAVEIDTETQKPKLPWMDIIFPIMKKEEKSHGECVIDLNFVQNIFWAEFIIPVESFLNKKEISDKTSFYNAIKNLCFCMWQFTTYQPLARFALLGFDLLPHLLEILSHPETLQHNEENAIFHSINHLIENNPQAVNSIPFEKIQEMISRANYSRITKELGFNLFKKLIESNNLDINLDIAKKSLDLLFKAEDRLWYTVKTVFDAIKERNPKLAAQALLETKQGLLQKIEHALLKYDSKDQNIVFPLLKQICTYMYEFSDFSMLRYFTGKQIDFYPALMSFLTETTFLSSSKGFQILEYIIKEIPDAITQPVVDRIVEELEPDKPGLGFALLCFWQAVVHAPKLINKSGLEKILYFINERERYISNYDRGTALKIYGLAAYYAPDLIDSDGIKSVENNLNVKDEQIVKGARNSYRNIGNMYSKKKDYLQAIKCFRALVQLEPNNPDFLNGLAWDLYLNNDFKESMEFAEKAVRIDDSKPYIWDTLACAYYGLEQYSKSWNAFQKAEKIKPGYVGTKEVYDRVKEILKK